MKNRSEMSDLEYEIWCELVHKRCGIFFTPSRRHFLQSRLWERMQALNMISYSEYYHYVLYNPQGNDEWGLLLDLLLNNESSFFRHMPSFDALTEHVLPALMPARRRQGTNTLSFWSAGCANGQEAYSLAMAVHEIVRPDEMRLWQVKVWATDISQRSLNKARNGRYKPYDIRNMPSLYQKKYMCRSENGTRQLKTGDRQLKTGDRQLDADGRTLYKITDVIRQMVQFSTLNLADPDSYRLPGQDVIFCQNVLIYFQPQDRLDIVTRLCSQLNPGGYLFLAPAEMVGLKLPDIRLVRLEDSLIYQRSL